MTAYGRSSLKTELGQISVEIQSVNRKHLEINVQLPKELSHFEIEIKKILANKIVRGNVAVKIGIAFENEVPYEVKPNLPLARQLKEGWDQIANALDSHATKEFDLQWISHVEDLFIIEENREADEVYRKYLSHVLNAALMGFNQMKTLEGDHLQIDILNRLAKIGHWVDEIQKKTPYATQKYREKLIARLEEVLPGKFENEERILREVAVYAEKIDIAEEITRFECHLGRMKELIHSSETGIGKTLEFVIQELNREVTTIGNKSSDLEIARLVIDIKSELERIREQIQNVE